MNLTIRYFKCVLTALIVCSPILIHAGVPKGHIEAKINLGLSVSAPEVTSEADISLIGLRVSHTLSGQKCMIFIDHTMTSIQRTDYINGLEPRLKECEPYLAIELLNSLAVGFGLKNTKVASAGGELAIAAAFACTQGAVFRGLKEASTFLYRRLQAAVNVEPDKPITEDLNAALVFGFINGTLGFLAGVFQGAGFGFGSPIKSGLAGLAYGIPFSFCYAPKEFSSEVSGAVKENLTVVVEDLKFKIDLIVLLSTLPYKIVVDPNK